MSRLPARSNSTPADAGRAVAVVPRCSAAAHSAREAKGRHFVERKGQPRAIRPKRRKPPRTAGAYRRCRFRPTAIRRQKGPSASPQNRAHRANRRDRRAVAWRGRAATGVVQARYPGRAIPNCRSAKIHHGLGAERPYPGPIAGSSSAIRQATVSRAQAARAAAALVNARAFEASSAPGNSITMLRPGRARPSARCMPGW